MANRLPNFLLWTNFEQCDGNILEKLNENFNTIDFKTALGVTRPPDFPSNPSLYDAIIKGPPNDADTSIYFWDGTQWQELQAVTGMYGFDVTNDTPIIFDGTEWVRFQDYAPNIEAANIGTGEQIFKGMNQNEIELRTLTGTAPITVTTTGDNINISSSAVTDGSQINPTDATNLNVFSAKIGSELAFKSLRAGSNVTLTDNAGYIEIASTGGGGGGTPTPVWNFRQVNGAVTVLTDDKYLRGNIGTVTFPDASTTLGQTVFTIPDDSSTVSFADNNGALNFDRGLVYGYYKDTQNNISLPIYAYVAGNQGAGGVTWYQISNKPSDIDDVTTRINVQSSQTFPSNAGTITNVLFDAPQTNSNNYFVNASGSNIEAAISGLYAFEIELDAFYTGNITDGRIFYTLNPSNTSSTQQTETIVTERIIELSGAINYVNWRKNTNIQSIIYLNSGDSVELTVNQLNSANLVLNLFTGNVKAKRIY